MRKRYRKGPAILAVFAAAALLTGCGCGKKEKPDDESTKVMQITITPEVTPTMAPEQVSADAVVTNGKYTMVNQYLADKKSGTSSAGDAAGDTAAGSDAAADAADDTTAGGDAKGTDPADAEGAEDGSEE